MFAIVSADHSLVERWVRGWTRSRNAPDLVPTAYGFRVDVGLPKHRARHIVPAIDPLTFGALAAQIDTPWVYLKVFASRDELAPFLGPRWEYDEPRHLMSSVLDPATAPTLSGDFDVRTRVDRGTLIAEVVHASGELASSGRAAIVGDTATFDQIGTEPAFQRRGLARSVMFALAQGARERGARMGVLVASEEGYRLYTALGWRRDSDFTSAVISRP